MRGLLMETSIRPPFKSQTSRPGSPRIQQKISDFKWWTPLKNGFLTNRPRLYGHEVHIDQAFWKWEDIASWRDLGVNGWISIDAVYVCMNLFKKNIRYFSSMLLSWMSPQTRYCTFFCLSLLLLMSAAKWLFAEWQYNSRKRISSAFSQIYSSTNLQLFAKKIKTWVWVHVWDIYVECWLSTLVVPAVWWRLNKCKEGLKSFSGRVKTKICGFYLKIISCCDLTLMKRVQLKWNRFG